MRATMIAYLFAADLWTLTLLAGSGYYDTIALTRAALSLPILALGVWLGSRHFASARPASYRKAVLWLLLSLSAIGLALIALIEMA